MKINDKYLHALLKINDWVTISEWADKVAEVFPEELIKADKQAESQKNETTGLREIAARLSSQTSKNAFSGRVEVDASERPKKVRWASDELIKIKEDLALEEDIEPISRREKESIQYDKLTVEEKFRITEFKDCISQLNKYFGTSFDGLSANLFA